MSANYDQLTHFRRQLHAHPEVSGNEKATAARVLEFLQICAPDELLTGIGGYGIVATWDSGLEGESLLFRAELDALPIEEVNDFAHQSVHKGVSHKCGHDGHATILCGLAQYLAANRPPKGKVSLLFQPAEETGEGARAMLDDVKFNAVKPDFAFALHNLPGYALSEVVIKEGAFSAAVNSMIIHLYGKTAHAAEPENGLNPALALAEIVKESLAKACNQPERADFRVITPVYLELGEKAYGVSAGKAAIHFTLRCWNDENLRQLEQQIELLATQIAKQHQLEIAFEYTQTFHANQNDATATEIVRKAATAADCVIARRDYPFKWGEDFGLFTAHFRGCMFGLGAGENIPALHNPDYDFPDTLVETGVRVFSGIIEQILADKQHPYV